LTRNFIPNELLEASPTAEPRPRAFVGRDNRNILLLQQVVRMSKRGAGDLNRRSLRLRNCDHALYELLVFSDQIDAGFKDENSLL
jgi:hypothetical protein